MAHRALFCAALAEGESRVGPIADSEDMLATMGVLEGLGASFSRRGEDVLVRGCSVPKPVKERFFCRESGSTLRFAVPLFLLSGERVTLTGAGRLMERPLGVYETLCRKRGFFYEQKNGALTLCGVLSPGRYTVPGNVSSQFITGLLFALPLLSGDSELVITEGLESASYVDMTLVAMADFGVRVERRENVFFIPGGQRYLPRDYRVEGDFSNAAFLEGLGLLSGSVQVTGLREDSLQGDRVYRWLLPMLKEGCPEVDLRDCPDLGPVLMALAALEKGARFVGTARLKIKESDRGAAMAEELSKCGIDVVVEENTILVKAGTLRAPREVISGHNDHRIVMAMALVLSVVGGEIEGAEAVKKSYPDFFEAMKTLGIEVMEQ
ncbi:MAG: 3-phosphoshikimate 1-carboxyvinyltransferase [Clostridia bacterium]|nr:3-phosphoshikimate 1-carboxyvinyltransferase [Clostridia bacterium]